MDDGDRGTVFRFDVISRFSWRYYVVWWPRAYKNTKPHKPIKYYYTNRNEVKQIKMEFHILIGFILVLAIFYAVHTQFRLFRLKTIKSTTTSSASMKVANTIAHIIAIGSKAHIISWPYHISPNSKCNKPRIIIILLCSWQ